MNALLAALALLASPLAGPAPSAERGKALFESRALGTNGKRCVDCHGGGKRLDEVAESTDAEVAAYANSCIEAMLAGKKLPEGSADLRAIVVHLRAIAPRAK